MVRPLLEFNRWFRKLYNRIPDYIKPSEAAARVTYAVAYELDFALLLRERSPTLDQMFKDVVDLEGNTLDLRKLEKSQIDLHEKRKTERRDFCSIIVF
jgi:hypothetical protein